MCPICSEINCRSDVFQEGKCILHCEKNNWLDNHPDYDSWIESFYLTFTGYLESGISDFVRINFPKLKQNILIDHDINGADIASRIEFIECHFWEDILIEPCPTIDTIDTIVTIVFRTCIFHGNVEIKTLGSHYNKVPIEVLLFESRFHKELKIENFKQIKLQIDSCKLLSTVFSRLQGTFDIRNIEPRTTDSYCDIRFSECKFKLLRILRSTVTRFTLQNSEFLEGSEFYVKNCSIANFWMSSLLIFNNILELTWLTGLKKLIIVNTDLSNFVFSNIDLLNSIVELSSINIISNGKSVILNTVLWPDSDNFKSTRDIYRQLKFVNEQQGNIIESNKFYSLEMKSYHEYISSKNRRKKYILDRFIFWLNKHISNYQQNWLKPLIILLFTALITFLPQNFQGLSTFIRELVCNSKFEFYILERGFNEFIYHLNPFSTSLPDKFPALWLLYKVSSFIILYQFIVALRRNTRR